MTFNSTHRDKLYFINNPINYPFSENEIIFLQDKFLTNGIHHLNIKNKNNLNKIINSILSSLNYYQNIAFLSDDNSVTSDMTNLYQYMNNDFCENDLNKNLFTFLSNDFYFDFLWVEVNDNLLNQKWYNLFLSYIQELNINKYIPIILISYN